MKPQDITLSAMAVVFAVIGLFCTARTPAAAPNGSQDGAARRGDASAIVHGTGTIEPQQVMDVSALVEGRVVAFGDDRDCKGKPVDYGSRVAKGQVLAVIDDSIYKARLEGEQASLKVAEANMDLAKAKLQAASGELQEVLKLGRELQPDARTAKLNENVAKAGVDVAQAEVERQRAAVRAAQIALDRTKLTSPIDGVIIDRRVNVGQTVVASPHAPSLFLIAADLKKLEVWTSVNEADIGRIKVGQPVEFRVDAFPGTVFKGKVAQVRLNAQMTQNVVTYTVVVSFDNPDSKLLPYMTANVLFGVGE